MIPLDTKKVSVADARLGMNVSVMGTVVYRSVRSDFGFFVVDDGTGTIPVKIFSNVEALRKIREGDIVDVFGGVEEYREEPFIRPVLIRKIDDPNWYLVRKLELLETGENKVLKIIKEIDSGNGAELGEIQERLGASEDELKKEMTKVLSDGLVYEPNPRHYKVTDDGI